MVQHLGTNNKKYIATGLSLEQELFKKVEVQRGYENRSHYISRLLSANLNIKDKSKK